MKLKDTFWLGLLVGLAVFAMCYLILSLFSWGEAYHRAPFLLSFIPGIILFRMAMVQWEMEKTGKGILVVTCVGMLLVFFLI